jgi:hypothetical protein
MKRIVLSCVATFALILFVCGSAHAQATRTWISGVGDDANPCSRTAPCKTFAGAISKTANKGEIDCLDPGGFGAVTITKSITLDCTNTIGGVLTGGTNAIVISSGSGPVNVILRGLDFNGAGTSLSAIKILTGGTLLIEHCRIYGFGASTNPAVNIVPNAPVQLDIRDTTISNNLDGAVLLAPTGAATVTASLTRVHMYYNTYGLRAQDNTKATVFQSVASNNSNAGFTAVSTTNPAEINVAFSVSTNNASGLRTFGTNATIRMLSDTITDNATGVNVAGGTIAGSSPASTLNAGNTTPGGTNQTSTLQ